MLVVTRKPGEGIKIGDNIEITIVKIDDNSVKVSINAPKEVKILRSEHSRSLPFSLKWG